MRKCGAIILAAGKGTRMKSIKAKVSFYLSEKSLVQRVVDTALEIDCDLLGIVVGYRKDEVIATIQSDDRIKYIEQKEQLGTGHAVMMAEDIFKEYVGDVYILCGDVPLLSLETLIQLRDVHREYKAACTVLTIVLPDAGSYGRIVRNEQGNVVRIVEFKDANDEERRIKEINSGIYCFDSAALFDALKKIDNNNKQGEYYLTDVLEILNKEGKKVSAVMTNNIAEVSGINSQLQLAELETEHFRKIRNYWMNNGVSIENPETVIIGDDVVIESDVSISANSILKGKTKIGKFCRIGVNSYIYNSCLEKSTITEGYNVVVNQELDSGVIMRYGEKKIK